MKVSKIFGCVLGLHLCIIAILIVQPGCQTGQPPTQTYTQNRTAPTASSSASSPFSSPSVTGASRMSGDLIPATRVEEGQGLDAAFNAGFDGFDSGSGFGSDISSGSSGDFNEFDDVAPIEPLGNRGGQTVDVSGPSFETYTVKKGDNLWAISKRYNVSLNDLYAANGLSQSSVLRVGQQIQIPVEVSAAEVGSVTPDTYQPSGYNQASASHTVQRGDTLSKIAKQYDTTIGALKAANGKSSDLIRVGEKLVVPVGDGAVSTPAEPASTSVSLPAPSLSTSGARTHTVRAGEYPAKIAKMYGMTTGELLAINSITDPRKLRVGQKLKVSGSGTADNVDSRTETVVAPAHATSARAVPAARPAPIPVENSGPVEIRVVEADPLVEGEVTEIESDDDIFDNAVEIPVIRLEE